MRVEVRTEPKGKWIQLDVDAPLTVEDIIQVYRKETGHTPFYVYFAASVDNELVQIDTVVCRPCRIEFLDMRTQAVNLIYQNSLSLIYLKAVNDILPDADVEIENALNRGLYTEIYTAGSHGERSLCCATEDLVRRIEGRMKELIDADITIEKGVIPRDEALEMFEREGRTVEKRNLEKREDLRYAGYCSLLDYRAFFFSLMIPSTSYINIFGLEKYEDGILLKFPSTDSPGCFPDEYDGKVLYDSFEEAKDWLDLLKLRYVPDLNAVIRGGREKELFLISEALHEKKIVEIAKKIKESGKKIILIAGPSSSGKTTFAQRLCVQLAVLGIRPMYMGTDDYFVEREDTPLDEFGEPDYEGLSAIDIGLFNDNLKGLLSGREVDMPVFDFMTGRKVFGTRITKVKEGTPVVIEGIHGLNEELTKEIPREDKFKIYISPFTQLNIDGHNRIPTTDARLLRRICRDASARGNDVRSTINSWPRVHRAERKNIFPYIGESDVVFNSVHAYEIAVLKKYVRPLLESVPKDAPEYIEAERLLGFLSVFEEISDDSCIANNSIIREFIGGNIFTR